MFCGNIDGKCFSECFAFYGNGQGLIFKNSQYVELLPTSRLKIWEDFCHLQVTSILTKYFYYSSLPRYLHWSIYLAPVWCHDIGVNLSKLPDLPTRSKLCLLHMRYVKLHHKNTIYSTVPIHPSSCSQMLLFHHFLSLSLLTKSNIQLR